MNTKNSLSKYRSIDAASPGELEKVRLIVLEDRNYLPKYHIYPKTGLLNDPNGLVFDGDNYHIFFQWYPYDSIHGMKHWAHLITKNFIHFTEIDPIVPTQSFEIHGCYSGGALSTEDGLLCFYTGNTRQGKKLERISYQNVALIDKITGKTHSKQCILETPKGYTEHLRDPKPWIQNGKIQFICAAQREDLTGCAIICEMDEKTTKLLGELIVSEIDNEDVFMWECPDLFKLNNQDVFIWCPQGIKPKKSRFNNIYSCLYAIGDRENTKFTTKHWDELDRGFDFYAPQTFAGMDDQIILMGWAGVPDAQYPSDKFSWQGMLTMPRVLCIKNDKLYQRPHEAIYSMVDFDNNVKFVQGSHNHSNLFHCYIRSQIFNEEFEINLFVNDNEALKLCYKSNVFKVDRTKTLQTDFMKKYGSVREVRLENLNNFEIFIDASIMEIYLNDGEFVFTSRFFMKNPNNNFEIKGNIELEIFDISSIKLWIE